MLISFARVPSNWPENTYSVKFWWRSLMGRWTKFLEKKRIHKSYLLQIINKDSYGLKNQFKLWHQR